MIINEKLFKDLFIESHKKLAIQSLRTLNDCENLLIVKDNSVSKLILYEIKNITIYAPIKLNYLSTFKFTIETTDYFGKELPYLLYAVINDDLKSLLPDNYSFINKVLTITGMLYNIKESIL